MKKILALALLATAFATPAFGFFGRDCCNRCDNDRTVCQIDSYCDSICETECNTCCF